MELENDEPQVSLRQRNFAQQWANALRAIGFGFWTNPSPGRWEYRINPFASPPLATVVADYPQACTRSRITVIYGDHAYRSGLVLDQLGSHMHDRAYPNEGTRLRVIQFGRAWRIPEQFSVDVLREDLEELRESSSDEVREVLTAYLDAIPDGCSVEQAQALLSEPNDRAVNARIRRDNLGVMPHGLAVVFYQLVQGFTEWLSVHNCRHTPSLEQLMIHQRWWSEETFGPGTRLKGCIDHILKEIEEIREKPEDVTEWADLIILAMDGAWRQGHSPQMLSAAIIAKQAKNRSRQWPDWRTRSEDEAIEHIRTADEVARG